MGRNLKLCMIAGERSGDLHGSMVAREIIRAAPDAEIFGMGGNRMKEAGVEILHDITEIAVVGFLEVLRNLNTFLSVHRHLVSAVEERRPDAVVLIDLPGFNLRFGPRVRKLGIPVIYYISPQTWAWGKRRTRKMRKFIDRFYVILPFEVEFYRREHINTEFVGHPLVDVLKTEHSRQEFRTILGVNDNQKLVALLPGSREHEIERMLPLMARSAHLIQAACPGTRFVLPAASAYISRIARRILARYTPEIDVRMGNAYDSMNASDAAIVTSGTATLEAGWFGVPFVIVYRMAYLSYLLARAVARIDRIGLINLLVGRTVAAEFVQNDATPDRIAAEIVRFLNDEHAAAEKRRELLRVRDLLGPGGASKRVADRIIQFVDSLRN